MDYLIGTDPEVFVKDSKTGRFVCAHGMVMGTKHMPEPVDDGALQVDGCALEFNITPAEDANTFSKRVQAVLDQLKERVFQIDKNFTICATPVAKFDEMYFLNEVPEEAKILGCDPDFNYLGQMNPSPADKMLGMPVRTAAGHLHIGWTGEKESDDADHFEDCRFVAEKFYLAGKFRPETNDEGERLRYYGASGAFRPKSYGVELRSPSNLWILSDKTRRAAYETLVTTMRSLEKK